MTMKRAIAVNRDSKKMNLLACMVFWFDDNKDKKSLSALFIHLSDEGKFRMGLIKLFNPGLN